MTHSREKPAMKTLPLILDNPPELSDEAAAQCLDFLQELTVAFEIHYGHQLRRYYEPRVRVHPDLFDDLEDDPLAF